MKIYHNLRILFDYYYYYRGARSWRRVGSIGSDVDDGDVSIINCFPSHALYVPRKRSSEFINDLIRAFRRKY